MKKFKLIIILCILDITLAYYLKILIENQITYNLNLNIKPLILQKKDIILNDIEDFVFEDYFQIISFNNESYNYKFYDDYLEISIRSLNDKYNYSYSIIEPQVIEKTVYQTITEYIDISNSNEYYLPEINYDTRLLCDSFAYEVNTELSYIIQDIGNNAIDSYEKVTCDYSALNPNQIGEYLVFLYTNNEKFDIKVKIF